jgi:hypothetical protein
MSTNSIALLVLIPALLITLLYIVRKLTSSKPASLGHHLLASGSVLHQVRRY